MEEWGLGLMREQSIQHFDFKRPSLGVKQHRGSRKKFTDVTETFGGEDARPTEVNCLCQK